MRQGRACECKLPRSRLMIRSANRDASKKRFQAIRLASTSLVLLRAKEVDEYFLSPHRMNRERTMANQWIDPSTCRSLAVLVESVTAPLLIEHSAPVCLELDIDTSIEVPADSGRTVELIQTLVGQALSEMTEGGDLTITACETVHGLELELADTGRDIEHRAQRLPMAAAAIGAQVVWQNCPQGGGAVTVTFRRQSGSGRMAA